MTLLSILSASSIAAGLHSTNFIFDMRLKSRMLKKLKALLKA